MLRTSIFNTLKIESNVKVDMTSILQNNKVITMPLMKFLKEHGVKS